MRNLVKLHFFLFLFHLIFSHKFYSIDRTIKVLHTQNTDINKKEKAKTETINFGIKTFTSYFKFLIIIFEIFGSQYSTSISYTNLFKIDIIGHLVYNNIVMA